MYSFNDQTNTHAKRQFFSNIAEDYEIICGNEVVHVLYSDIVYRQIEEILSQGSMIERIFILRTDNTTFSIWTALKKYNKEARYSLYKGELEVIKYFSPVEFHFDFHIADPQDSKELLASGAKQIFPKR